MDDYVDRVGVVGSIERELVKVSEAKYGLKSRPYLFSDVKQVRNGHGRRRRQCRYGRSGNAGLGVCCQCPLAWAVITCGRLHVMQDLETLSPLRLHFPPSKW